MPQGPILHRQALYVFSHLSVTRCPWAPEINCLHIHNVAALHGMGSARFGTLAAGVSKGSIISKSITRASITLSLGRWSSSAAAGRAGRSRCAVGDAPADIYSQQTPLTPLPRPDQTPPPPPPPAASRRRRRKQCLGRLRWGRRRGGLGRIVARHAATVHRWKKREGKMK